MTALLLLQFLTTQAAAGVCALIPALLAIDTTAEATLHTPSPANLRALEQAITNFEVQRAELASQVQLAAPIERFISSRISIVLTYQASGPGGLRRTAMRRDTTAIREAMQTLVSSSACGNAMSVGQAGAPTGEVIITPVPNDDTSQFDQIKAHLTPLRERTIIVLSTPVSLFAIAVVTTIFSGLVFVAVRRRRRGFARFICFLPVDLKIGQSQTTTHLIEISQSGANVSVCKPITQGTDLSVTIDGTQHDAQAVWANQSCAGVRFKTVIPKQQLAEMLHQNGGGFEHETAMA